MRITFVGAVPPIGGGIAQHGGNVVRALRSAGHLVDVWSWRAQYPSFLYSGASQIRDDVAPLPDARFNLRWWDPVGWLRAGRAARDSDLLVVPWITPAQGPALATITRAAGHRPEVIALVHNSRPHEGFPLVRPLTRLGLHRVDRVVAHAPQVISELAELGVARPGTATPHPPNVEVAPRTLPPPAPLRLAFLGFLRHYKGPDIAVEVLGRLRAAGGDVRLTIAGEAWEDPSSLEDLARQLGVADALEVDARYLADDELSDVIGNHHIVLLPYRSATQSGIVPLAQAGGRPVVATDVGGLADQITDGRDGRLVPAGDVEALAAAVRDVADDLEAYAERAAAASPTWHDVARAVTDRPG